MELFVGSHYLTIIATQLDAQISSSLCKEPRAVYNLNLEFPFILNGIFWGWTCSAPPLVWHLSGSALLNTATRIHLLGKGRQGEEKGQKNIFVSCF